MSASIALRDPRRYFEEVVTERSSIADQPPLNSPTTCALSHSTTTNDFVTTKHTSQPPQKWR